MISRQPRTHAGLRIIAAGCIVLWLVAASRCGIEHLCGCDHHHAEANASVTVAHHDGDRSQEAEATEHAHDEASDSHDSAQHSHDSHPHGGGDACCSTLMATAQFAMPFVIIKPVLEPLNFLCTVLQAHDPMFAAPDNRPERQAKDRNRILTPEVCLGPAHRNHAPPVFI